MGSYDRLIGKNIFISYVGLCFHTVLCAAISHRTQVWCQLARFRKHNQVRISLHIFLVTVISESQVGLEL